MGPGDIIADKYRLERLLGEGGMGRVFAAVNMVTGKQVAIKWLHAELGRGEEYCARFMREAQVASRIDHPNVVNVFDAGRHGESLFLVMELLQGETLADLLARGVQDHTGFLQLMLPVLRGVHAAHRLGVVHRDLKPDNIFLCRGPDGEAREPKVLDFGISKINEELGDGKRPLTREGSVFGTPQYMAPEQVRNSRAVDARADVYALGVILYRALSGQLPYDADTLPALALRIVEGNATPLRDLCPELDPGLSDVIMRALATDPDKRFASVASLGEALEPYAAGATFTASSSVSWSMDPEGGTAMARAVRTPARREGSPAPRGAPPAQSEPSTSDAPPTAVSRPRPRSENASGSGSVAGAGERPSNASPTPAARPRDSRRVPAMGFGALLMALAGGLAWGLFGPSTPGDVHEGATVPVPTPSDARSIPEAPAQARAAAAHEPIADGVPQAAPPKQDRIEQLEAPIHPTPEAALQPSQAAGESDAGADAPPHVTAQDGSRRRTHRERHRSQESGAPSPAEPEPTREAPRPSAQPTPLLNSDSNPYLQR